MHDYFININFKNIKLKNKTTLKNKILYPKVSYHHDIIIKFHFILSNCGSLENWFSINYMFVITCLYLYIFIFRYTHVDLWLHFCRFSFFSLLPPKINFNTRRRAFVTLHAKSISWPEDYFNLIIWFNFLFKVQEEFDYLRRAERLMIAE